LQRELDALRDLVDRVETETLLSGERCAERHRHYSSWRGGTGVKDWAECYCECICAGPRRQGFKTEMYDEQPGKKRGSSPRPSPSMAVCLRLLSSEIRCID
jgi:hypothetical protein